MQFTTLFLPGRASQGRYPVAAMVGLAAERPAAAEDNRGFFYFATDDGVLSLSDGVSWTVAGGISAPGTYDGQPAVWDTGTNTWVPGSFVAFGADPAHTGDIRLSAGGTIKSRRFAQDNTVVVANATDIAFGESAAGQASLGLEWGTGDARVRFQGNALFTNWSSGYDAVEMGRPIIGLEAQPSPYGVHGAADVTFAADADYTAPVAVYKYWWLTFNTGAWLGPHSIILPIPTTLTQVYEKVVFNNSAFVITVTNGGADTRALAAGFAQSFKFANSGVNYASPAWVP